MKKNSLFLFLFLALITGTVIGQVPQGIPYQAVARDAQGQPLASRAVKVRFSVLDSIATGNAVYTETHATNTSALGLFAVNVGMGTPVTGTFSGINWGVNSKFLKVELDTTAGGNNYVDLGTQQMMSVPYALYAGNSASVADTSNVTQISLDCFKCPVQVSSTSANTMTYEQAFNYCASLTEGGFTDWRLPSLVETDYCRFSLELTLPNIHCWTRDFSLGGSTQQFIYFYYISHKRAIGLNYNTVIQWNTFCIR